MNTFQRDELLSLAEEILIDPVHTWTFHAFVLPVKQQVDGPICMTLHCALGRMPKRRPDKWQWRTNGNGVIPVLHGYEVASLSAMDYFGITHEEVDFLFYPVSYYDRQTVRGLRRLPIHATAAQVSDQIKALVAAYEKAGDIKQCTSSEGQS